MARAPIVIGPQRSPMVDALTQSLMNRPATPPSYSMGSVVANALAPIGGAMIEKREEKKRAAANSAFGRLLAEAARAKKSGQDPVQAAQAMIEANKGGLGWQEGGAAFLENARTQLAQNIFGQQKPTETFEEVRDAQGNIIGQRSTLTGKVVADPRTPAVASTKLVEIHDPSSPTGTRMVSVEEARGKPGKPAKGLEFEVSPEGAVRVSTAGSGGVKGMAKPTQARLEKSAIDSANVISRVRDIRQSFDPKLLEVSEKARALITAGGEKLGIKPSKTERKQLTRMTRMRRRTINNVNRILNELSGAAVSPAEAERIKAGMPNAGSPGIKGLLDGDSPTEFQTKMEDVLQTMELAVARYDLARQTGDPNVLKMSLEDFAKQEQQMPEPETVQQPETVQAGQASPQPQRQPQTTSSGVQWRMK